MKPHFFCPQCQGLEIALERTVITEVEPKAACELCKWSGLKSELLTTIGVDKPNLWTSERVGNAMLLCAAKHAAGPMIQLLEFIGLAPKISGGEQEIASAQYIRSELTKAILEAVVTTAFERAAELVPEHLMRFDPALSMQTEKIFSYSGSIDGKPG